MSVTPIQTAPATEEVEVNARSYWLNRASLVGLISEVDYPKNITTPKLAELVKQRQAEVSPVAGTRGVNSVGRIHPEVSKMQDEATKLVRFKITVLDPTKSEWTGMYVTVGNDNLAPIKRAIYFIDTPWHAEKIIVEYLKSMKYVHRPSRFDKKLRGTFTNMTETKLLPVFHIEELDPLTEKELKALSEYQIKNRTGQQEQ